MKSILMLSQDVHPIPPLKGAAVEQWIEAVSHGLTRYEPYIFCPSHPTLPAAEVSGRVHYTRIEISQLYVRLFKKITRLDPYPYIQRVIDQAKTVDPVIIHLHNAPKFVLPLKKAFPAAKLILHMHNEKNIDKSLPIDCLVGCSEYIKSWYAEQGIRAQRFSRIRNGVDIKAFQPKWTKSAEDLIELKNKYGIPTNKKIILFVGRISPEKGPDLLVEAFRHLNQSDYHLLLVGEWPEGNPATNERVAFAENLKAKLSELSVTVLGCIPPKEIAHIYHLGDLLVIPSRFEEPFSMTAIEAMASGVPVLAIKRGGMVEYLKDGENAKLVERESSADQLAQAIDLTICDNTLLTKISTNARQTVEENFSWAQVVNETEALYDTLLATP